MADLDPLIRYHRHGLDEKQKFIAQLYREAEKLELQKQTIEKQMQKEITLAAEMASPEAQAYLGKYLEGARRKVRALETSIKKMDARIGAAQENLREAYAEMKKIEITQRNREKAEEAEQQKKEDQELDEIAIEGFRRKEE